MSTYYRLHDNRRDHHSILNEANWQSASYGDAFGDDVRHGVSACESIEELAAYFAQTGIDVGASPVIVELEADQADDEDHDVALGAVLVFPRSIARIITDTDAEWAQFDAALDAAFA